MSRFFSLLILGIFIYSGSDAQTISFQKVYPANSFQYGYAIDNTNNGGLVIAGWDVNSGTAQMSLHRLDSVGNTIWLKNYGGSTGDGAHSVRQTTDGGFIMTGWGKSFGSGDDDVYITKTDASGDLQWTQVLGGFTIDRGRCVQQTSDGGYIVAGHTNPFGVGVNFMFMIKTDMNGDTTWTKVYGLNGANAWWIEQTSDGGYIVTGNVVDGPGFSNVLLVKLDSGGDTTWTKAYGALNGLAGGYCVKEVSSGGYVVAGWTASFGAGNNDGIVIRTDASGNEMWTKTYGGQARDEFQSMCMRSNGNMDFVGFTESFTLTGAVRNAYLVGTDMNGDTLYTRSFGEGGAESAYACTEMPGGSLAITGWSTSWTNDNDVYLIRTDANGSTSCYSQGTGTIINTVTPDVTGVPFNQDYSPTVKMSPTMNENILTATDTSLCFLNTGIESVGSLSFVIYPNPTSAELNIIADAWDVDHIRVLDINGRDVMLVSNQRLRSTVNIDVSELGSGMYFIQVFNRDGKSGQLKFLKYSSD